MTNAAQSISDLGPTPILGANRFKIWSEHVGAHFIVDVAMPSPMFPSNGPVPVMFVTDGNICFGAAASLSGAMAMEPNGPPPHCVVGIGYEISGKGEKAEHHVIRTRDLSPCEDKRFEAKCVVRRHLSLGGTILKRVERISFWPSYWRSYRRGLLANMRWI